MMGICITPAGCMVEVLDSVSSQVADALRVAAGDMLTTLFSWWASTPSTPVDTATIHTAQSFVTTWVALPVAVVSLLSVVAWGVASQGATWLRSAVRGLIVFGIVSAGSIAAMSALQAWSESLTRGILAAVPSGDVGERLLQALNFPGFTPASAMFWSTVVFLSSAAQYVLMLFRDGAVLVLTVALPLAAAGQFSRGSAGWLPKVLGWQLAFVFMKPAGALVYFVGLSLFGTADGVKGVTVGVCLLIAAVLALPALLKLVTFATEMAPLQGSALGTAATVAGIASSVSSLASRAGQAGRGSGAATGGISVGTGATGAATVAHPAVAVGKSVVDAASTVARTAARAADPAPSGTAVNR